MVIGRNKILAAMLVVIFIFAAIPIVQIAVCAYGHWRGIPPPGVTVDQFYYLARIKQIGDGYPFSGNPFIYEYRNSMAPSFFVPDWLAAVPFLLGMPLAAAAAFNMIFWPLLLGLILYFIFEKLGLSYKASAAASVLTYLQVYWLVARPVSMQVIFPFFALFLLSYILWFRSPLDKKRILFLTLSVAVSFYIYAYLWQVIGLALLITLLFFFFKKDWRAAGALILSGFAAIVLALPAIIYTIRQILNPFYWETMARISLVITHIPPTEFLNYAKWVVVAIVLGLIVAFLAKRENDGNYFRGTLIPFFITGAALFAAAGDNIFIGKEMETANHIGRFIMFWFGIFFLCFLVRLWEKRKLIADLSYWKKTAVAVVLLAGFYLYFNNFYVQGVDFFARINKADIIAAQDYAAPAKWLGENTLPDQIVWTLDINSELYIPLLTKNYLLFSELAGLQLMPSAEVEERYLASNYFSNLTLQDIERDFRRYTGSGVAIHQYKTHNRKVKICRILRLDKLGVRCGEIETDISFRGEDYFKNLYSKYINEIKPNIKNELKKYGVSYIFFDKKADELKTPLSKLSGLERVYSDGRFEIYKISPR